MTAYIITGPEGAVFAFAHELDDDGVCWCADRIDAVAFASEKTANIALGHFRKLFKDMFAWEGFLPSTAKVIGVDEETLSYSKDYEK